MAAVGTEKFIYRILDTVGDGSGTTDMAVDGSTTPVVFMVKPADGETFKFKRLNLVACATSFDRADRYGDLTLATGFEIYTGNSLGVTKDFTAQLKITAWPMWGLLAGSDIPTSAGVGFDSFSVRWTFDKGSGEDIELVGSQGDYFAIKVNDNVAALIYQYVMLQGKQ